MSAAKGCAGCCGASSGPSAIKRARRFSPHRGHPPPGRRGRSRSPARWDRRHWSGWDCCSAGRLLLSGASIIAQPPAAVKAGICRQRMQIAASAVCRGIPWPLWGPDLPCPPPFPPTEKAGLPLLEAALPDGVGITWCKQRRRRRSKHGSARSSRSRRRRSRRPCRWRPSRPTACRTRRR